MRNILKRFLSNRWELVYTTANVDQHFAMLEKLRSQGIDFKTKGLNFGGGYGGGSGFSTVYHIYTRKAQVTDFQDASALSKAARKGLD